MVLLPLLLGLVFILSLTLKLLGGAISWWIVIVSGTIFILPIGIFFVFAILSEIKNKKY